MGHGDLKVISGGNEKHEIGSPQWAERLRKDTAVLARDIDTGYMQLAEKLWMIYDTPIDGDPKNLSVCTSWRDSKGDYYGSFDKYVDAELGINYKKAQRLRAIWKTFKVDLQLDGKMLDRVIKLGFSKVRELAREGVLTRRNVEAWVAKAENMTCLKLMTGVSKYLGDKAIDQSAQQATEEFEQEYNGSLASPPTRKYDATTLEGGTELDEGADREHAEAARDERRIEALEVNTRQFNCMLVGDQIETVGLALRRAAELSNSDKVGYNLSMICLDFIATNDFKFADEQSRIRFLAKFEKLTGYKMIIVDPEIADSTEAIVYGIKTLEKLARG